MSKQILMEHPDATDTILIQPSKVEHMRSLGWVEATGAEPTDETDQQPEEIES